MANQEQVIHMLIKSDNYRDFLTDSFQLLKETKRHFSLATLAQKIGCRSRSYPQEVMSGRRSLSFDYAPGFAAAFGLKGDAKKLFLKFVELERGSQAQNVKQEIKTLKIRLKNRTVHRERKPKDLFSDSLWIDVYAALGSTDNGATVAEVSKRSKLGLELVQTYLQKMKEKNVVRFEDKSELYFPETLHHFFEKADQDETFQKRYLDILKRVETKAKVSLKSERDLFMCSTFSVQVKDLAQLKEDLRELVAQYVQNAESASGEQLVHLVTGLIS